MTTSEPRLFVTGATGQLGRLVIEALLKRVLADTIVAGVRSLESAAAEDLRAQGVTLRVADYARPWRRSTRRCSTPSPPAVT